MSIPEMLFRNSLEVARSTFKVIYAPIHTLFLILWQMIGNLPFAFPAFVFSWGFSIISIYLYLSGSPNGGLSAVERYYGIAPVTTIGIFVVWTFILRFNVSPKVLSVFYIIVTLYTVAILRGTIDGFVSPLGWLASLYLFVFTLTEIIYIRQVLMFEHRNMQMTKQLHQLQNRLTKLESVKRDIDGTRD